MMGKSFQGRIKAWPIKGSKRLESLQGIQEICGHPVLLFGQSDGIKKTLPKRLRTFW